MTLTDEEILAAFYDQKNCAELLREVDFDPDVVKAAIQYFEKHGNIMTKNKCTIEDIEGVIVKEESFKLGLKTTVVLLTLKNGFEVIGKSGCVDPANYDHEIGVKYARARALDEIWMLEGYSLQNEIK